jgi:hypothetical protein
MGPYLRRIVRWAWRLLYAGAERFELLHALYPQNVVYWPLDAQVWDMEGPLAAIYREADIHLDKSRL